MSGLRPRAAAPGLGQKLEVGLERTMFAIRWIMAPVYLCLLATLVLLVCKFVQEFASSVPILLRMKVSQLITLVLTLIDLSLAGNLVVIVALSGYENFISRMDLGGHVDRPAWLGQVDFTGLKLKVIASIVAIASVEMLKTFLDVEDIPREQILLRLVLYMGFVVAGVLMALMDRLSGHAGADGP